MEKVPPRGFEPLTSSPKLDVISGFTKGAKGRKAFIIYQKMMLCQSKFL